MKESGNKTTVALQGLHACSGCEIALIDAGQQFITFLEDFVIVHLPLLMDHKYFEVDAFKGQAHIQIPEAEIGLVSGGVANEEQEAILKKMRDSCQTLVALGTCATHGGIPALVNSWTWNESLATILSTCSTEQPASTPKDGLPRPLERVYALDEMVDIDMYVPGCPPRGEEIVQVIRALARGEDPVLPQKSVCDTCPALRKGKVATKAVKRFVENASFDPDQPLEEMRCLLEQGFMCMGPVTAAGCAGAKGPGCIVARVPCRGCFGPVKDGGNQMLDMINGLASMGVDWKSIEDRRLLLRFMGAHGLLRPASAVGDEIENE
ncbi:MAG: methyl viologen-reducing hydrogenase [Thermodesulfobacteria bacterium]|nr:methyl viologen-reducing hydrogenase [Thermodesulfobacteriota bacterium]